MRYLSIALAFSFALLMSAGCNNRLPTLTPQMAAKRDLLLLTQEPVDSVTVRDARKAIADKQDSEVIVSGEIGGVTDPWEKGRASFMITQVGGSAAAHDHDHDHDHAHGDHDHAGHDHADHDHAEHDHADHKHGDDEKKADEADHKHADHDHAHDEHDHAGHDHGDHDHAHDHAGHDHAHGDAGHDHDNCPFCQRAKKGNLESLAIVQFVDADGSVLPVDARDLFGVREKQKVVVKGRAKIDDLGNLVVSADGIYIAKP